MSYRLQGAGQKQVVAMADPLLCPDPLAFLTVKLGRLAFAALDSVPVAVPGWEVPIGELLDGAAEPAPLPIVGSDPEIKRDTITLETPTPDDDPDPPPPPAGHPALDPAWAEPEAWHAANGWEPADLGDGWGVDSSGTDVPDLVDHVAGLNRRGAATMLVQPNVQAPAWRGAEPGPLRYPLRV